jgi:hypothetical protein
LPTQRRSRREAIVASLVAQENTTAKSAEKTAPAKIPSREDSVIYVVATLTVKPEKRVELIAGAQACVAETRKEVGNIAYDMH